MRMPQGRSTITPRIITLDVPGVVGFIKTVFGARGELQTAKPVDLTIGDSIVILATAAAFDVKRGELRNRVSRGGLGVHGMRPIFGR